MDSSSSDSTLQDAELNTIETQLVHEQQAISELVHYVSLITPSAEQSSTTNSSCNEQLKRDIGLLEQEIQQKASLLHQLDHLHNGSSSSSSSSSEITPELVSKTLFTLLPQFLIREHELLLLQNISASTLINAHNNFAHDSNPLLCDIAAETAKLRQDLDDYFTSQIEAQVMAREHEVRHKTIMREDEDQERVALVQKWHKDTSLLLEKIKVRATNVNFRGSELQHSLGSKREELQRANQELDFAQESLRMYHHPNHLAQNSSSSSSFSDVITDNTNEILLQLQNQFTDLQSELHLRPTHVESGLDRLREQIVTLSQELTKNRLLVSEAASREEEAEESHGNKNNNGGVLTMKQELIKIENMRKLRQELVEKISATRTLIEGNQHIMLDELKIEEKRKELVSREQELSREVEMLRDRLLTDDDDDDEDDTHLQNEENRIKEKKYEDLF